MYIATNGTSCEILHYESYILLLHWGMSVIGYTIDPIFSTQ